MGTHLRVHVLSERYPMNTRTRQDGYQKASSVRKNLPALNLERNIRQPFEHKRTANG